MDKDTMERPERQILDIRDQPVLERGVPAEGEDMDPWLGAMLRSAVILFSEPSGGTAWEQIRDGLDVVTACLRDELLPCAAGKGEVVEVEEARSQQYLEMACPPVDYPEERRDWARVMGHTMFGVMITYQPMPPDDPEFDRWWADMMRGLWAFVAYVRSENGPLTWAAA